MQNQNFAFDILGVSGRWRVERTMKSHETLQVGARPRQFERGAAAETVTDNRQFVHVHVRLFAQFDNRCARAIAPQRAIGFVRARQFASFSRVFRAFAFAIYIERERDITHAGEHSGAPFFVIGEAEPLMRDQNAGTLAFEAIVVGQIAL